MSLPVIDISIESPTRTISLSRITGTAVPLFYVIKSGVIPFSLTKFNTSKKALANRHLTS